MAWFKGCVEPYSWSLQSLDSWLFCPSAPLGYAHILLACWNAMNLQEFWYLAMSLRARKCLSIVKSGTVDRLWWTASRIVWTWFHFLKIYAVLGSYWLLLQWFLKTILIRATRCIISQKATIKRLPKSAAQSDFKSLLSLIRICANVESARTRQVASKWKIIRDCSVFPCFSSTSYDFSCFKVLTLTFLASCAVCSAAKCFGNILTMASRPIPLCTTFISFAGADTCRHVCKPELRQHTPRSASFHFAFQKRQLCDF